MSKVHTFPFVTRAGLTGDFRLPFQYRGPGQFEEGATSLAEHLLWIEENIEINNSAQTTISGTSGSAPVPAGKWLMAFAIETATSQTVRIGTTPGGDELGEVAVTAGTPATVQTTIYGGASGATIHFTMSATITVTRLIL